MGGKGSDNNRGYILPIAFTREMKLALMRLSIQMGNKKDLQVAGQAIRAGLLVYEVLTEDDCRAMNQRKNVNGTSLVSDSEADFLISKDLVNDWRINLPAQIQKRKDEEKANTLLNKQLAEVIIIWPNQKEHNKKIWIQRAKEHPELPNSKKLLAFLESELDSNRESELVS